MELLIFSVGVILNIVDLVYRISVSEKRLTKQVEWAMEHGQAKLKAKWTPFKVVLAVVYIGAYKFAQLKFLWVALGLFTLWSAFYWLNKSFRGEENQEEVPLPEGAQFDNLVKSMRIQGLAYSLTILALWAYSWKGIIF